MSSSNASPQWSRPGSAMGTYSDEPRPANAADMPTARVDERTALMGGHSRTNSIMDPGSAFGASTIASISGSRTDGQKGKKRRLAKIQQRSRYYIPVLAWLPVYDWSLFAGDLTSGITLACLLVPQSLSYASTLAHLPAINGLFGVIIPSAVYALLGTCPQLSVGPEAALSLMTGQAVAEVLAELPKGTSAADKIAIATNVTTAVTFLAGLITFLLGLLRLGFLDAVLSRPLLRGFVTAVGAVIAVSQSIILLGLQQLAAESSAQAGSTLEKLIFLIENVGNAHALTALISAVSIVFLLSARMLKRRFVDRLPVLRFIPEILIAVVVSTVLSHFLGWHHAGVAVLGHVDVGQVHLHLPWHRTGPYLRNVVGTALTISVLGFVDSIVSAKQNASRFGYSLSGNRELVALGAGNVGAACISGSIVGFGSITRSRLNANAGARTPMSSLICAGLVTLAAFFLVQYIYHLPMAVLGSIVVLVVYSILQEAPEDVMFFWRLRAWSDLGLMATTFLVTVAIDLEVGIAVSVALSLMLVVAKSAQMRVHVLGRIPGTDEWERIEADTEEQVEIPGVLIVRIRESLTFANAGVLKDRLRRLERYGVAKHHPSDAPSRSDAQVVLLHMGDVLSIDASGAQILLETVEQYVHRQVGLYFVHAEPHRALFERVGILDLIGPSHMAGSVKAALDAHFGLV